MPMQDPAHPGLIILHECIGPLGLSVPEAAAALGVPAGELSDLVAGRAGLSPEMAIRVGRVFGGSARSWYGMQAAYGHRASRNAVRRHRGWPPTLAHAGAALPDVTNTTPTD